MDEETMETVTDFIFLGSKIPADGDYSHEIKDICSLEELWQTLENVLKSRDITLLQSSILPKLWFLQYGCENWTIKKAGSWRIDAFEMWCWRKLPKIH